MKNILYIYLFFTLIVYELNAQNTKQNFKRDTLLAKHYAEDGNKNYDSDNYIAAVENFSNAIKYDKLNYKYYLLRGQSKALLNNYADALIDLTKAESIYNNDLDIYYFKAFCEKSLEKYGQAILDFTTLIKYYPNHDKAHFWRGECNYFLGNFEKAVADYDTAIILNPKENDFYKLRGVVNYKLSRYNLALQDFYSFSRLKGTIKGTRIEYYMGLTYYFSNQYDSAIVYLKNYANKFSDFNAYIYVAFCYRSQGDTINTRKYFMQSVKTDPKAASPYFYYGETEWFYKNCDKSMELFENYISHLKDKLPSSDFYRNRALTNACLNDTAAALLDFDKAIQTEKTNDKVYKDRIRVLFSPIYQKRDALVVKDVEQCIKFCNDSGDLSLLYNLKGFINDRLKDSIFAEKDFLKAISYKPSTVYLYCNIAEHYLFYRTSELYKTEIFTNLKTALKVDKSYLGTYKLLAYSYYVLNDDAKNACEILEESEKYGKDSEIEDLKRRLCKVKKNKISLDHIQLFIFNLTDKKNPLMNYLLSVDNFLNHNQNIKESQ